MFGKLKDMFSKEKGKVTILSPLEGKAVPLSQVNDATFSGEMIGKGLAVIPSGGRVVSPFNGTVSVMFDTGHAVSLTGDDGTEVLIHVGLDTVKLKGSHYKIHAHNGDKVKTGDLLIEFDREKIIADGYDVITPVVICNSNAFSNFDLVTGQDVREGGQLMTLTK